MDSTITAFLPWETTLNKPALPEIETILVRSIVLHFVQIYNDPSINAKSDGKPVISGTEGIEKLHFSIRSDKGVVFIFAYAPTNKILNTHERFFCKIKGVFPGIGVEIPVFHVYPFFHYSGMGSFKWF